MIEVTETSLYVEVMMHIVLKKDCEQISSLMPRTKNKTLFPALNHSFLT